MSKKTKWGRIPVEVGDGPRDIDHWVFNEEYSPGLFMGTDHITVFLPDHMTKLVGDDHCVEIDYEWCVFQADLRDMVEEWIDLMGDHAVEYGGDLREYAAVSLETLANVIRGKKHE